MPRPKGKKNPPGSMKPGKPAGRKGRTSLGRYYTEEQILSYKARILEYMSGHAPCTVSDAATALSIPPVRAWAWLHNDKDFQEMTRMTREVAADALETELAHYNNPIPKMMILKGYRPMFRDNYHTPGETDKFAALLAELKKLAGQPAPAAELPPIAETRVTVLPPAITVIPTVDTIIAKQGEKDGS